MLRKVKLVWPLALLLALLAVPRPLLPWAAAGVCLGAGVVLLIALVLLPKAVAQEVIRILEKTGMFSANNESRE